MLLKPFAKHNCSRFIQPGKTAKDLARVSAQNLDVQQVLLSRAISDLVPVQTWWKSRRRCAQHAAYRMRTAPVASGA